MFPKLLLAGSLLAASTLAAAALTEAERTEFRRNCTADYSRLCSAFDPDSAEVQKCFRDKIAQVSPRCQATIQKMGAGAR